MKRLLLLAAVVIVCCPGLALADGKFFSPEKVPPDLPYQRALIAHDGARELLILQSKFDGKAEDFGWVIPLPAVPELASISGEQAQRIFMMLDMTSAPIVTLWRTVIFGGVFVIFFGLAASLLVISMMRRLRTGKWPASIYISPGSGLAILLVIFLVAAIAIPNALGRGGVEVVSAKQVGIYDVKVIKAQGSEDIIAWLNEHGYKFTETDKDAFEDYIKQGWCFVTARVNLKKAEKEGFSSDEGLVNPLVMLFESKQVVYPLALTGTIGNDTVVLLYVFDSHKVTDTTGRFALRYADKRRIEHSIHRESFQPEDFYEKWNFKQTFLTKLKTTLKPEQMKEDLILQHAPDDKPYREHIYRW